ncbi:hypothetical protein F5Y03DRAFT_340292 [Xylaria venustula]|nr:hypothetical protein F5Y03DRAFT_340292 [Xylaria venustula]
MLLFIFALLIVEAPCLDISAAGSLNVQIGLGTSTTSTTTPHHYWIPTSSTATPTTTSLNLSRATSDAGGVGSHANTALTTTELATQNVTRTTLYSKPSSP